MTESDYTQQLAERGRQIAAQLARQPRGMYAAHAALLIDDDRDTASTILIDEFGKVGSGPFARNGAGTFDVFAAMSLVCRWGDRLSAAALEHVRSIFTAGVLSRGNTENHWLMHYAGNLLAAERWADEPQWWNGLPPAAMAAEAHRWLCGIIRSTARCGHHEYDSPQYHPWHLLPMVVLADHAADEELRGLAAQAATLFVADMALEYFHGAWAGGHAREGYRENTWTRSGNIAALQYYYFGGEAFDPEGHHGHPMAGIAITASWCPPALLARMAVDGERPRVVKKTKAPRQIFRHSPGVAKPVRKYTYLSRSFALGSSQLGLPGAPAGPIDLVSWDLTWNGPRHSAKIAATHPFRSPLRFSAFLGGLPHTIGRGIAAHKPYLQSPDRLFGATPYERMLQHEGALLVLYRIPLDDDNPYVNLYLPKTTSWRHAAGWLCGDMGDFYTAVRPIGTYRWELIIEEGYIDGWLLRLEDHHAGVALEAVEADSVDSFDDFVARRAVAGLDLSRWPAPGQVSLTTTTGHCLALSWPAGEADVHRVDGRVVDYDAYPLYAAPGVEAPLGSGRVSLAQGEDRVELDFGIEEESEALPLRVIG